LDVSVTNNFRKIRECVFSVNTDQTSGVEVMNQCGRVKHSTRHVFFWSYLETPQTSADTEMALKSCPFVKRTVHLSTLVKETTYPANGFSI
jgi:hypothetical protein